MCVTGPKEVIDLTKCVLKYDLQLSYQGKQVIIVLL